MTANAGRSPMRNVRTRDTTPSRGASTVRAAKGGIRTRYHLERSIRSLHHQRFKGDMRSRIGLAAVVFKTMHPASSPPQNGSGGTFALRWPEGLRPERSIEAHHHPEKISKRIISRHSGIWRAAIANPLFGSPCHRWTAIARAVPSGRPRACGPRAKARAGPGIRVSRILQTFRTSGAGK